jgi:hypothetical protein
VGLVLTVSPVQSQGQRGVGLRRQRKILGHEEAVLWPGRGLSRKVDTCLTGCHQAAIPTSMWGSQVANFTMTRRKKVEWPKCLRNAWSKLHGFFFSSKTSRNL